ncbi:Hydroxamate-type ferrichrome siderophore peptide synthetase [Venturia inaequalis]|nr:Hydroxamate-type ferrichrome siderophore peptide synthetase [Venturia inaequalis]
MAGEYILRKAYTLEAMVILDGLKQVENNWKSA